MIDAQYFRALGPSNASRNRSDTTKLSATGWVFADSLPDLCKQRKALQKAVPNLLDKESPLSLRQREIVILRTTANRNCEYEWGVHVAIFAQTAGFSDAQIAATRYPAEDRGLWDADEHLLIRCIDQFCEKGTVEDTDLCHFQEIWSLEQQLEIMALCGTYHTVSLVANTARLGGENFGARFPQAGT